MKTDTVYSIARASIVLSSLSLMSKAIGFGREVIYAKTFGLSSEYDLFLSSTALITVINIAFIFLIQHYFIPTYNKLKNESPQSGEDFFNYTFWWSIFIGILLVLILYLVARPLLSAYMKDVNQIRLVKGIKIFSIYLFTIPFNNGIALISAYMQAKFRFVFPAVSQIILNIIVIVLVLFFSDKINVFILPIAFVFANVIAFIILLRPVINIISFNYIKIFNREIGKIEYDKLFYLLIIEVLSLSYVLVDRYFISRIPEGGIAAMNYAVIIFALPISIISIPLNTTLFSRFSRDNVRSISNTKFDLFKSIQISTFIIMPLGFIFYFWGGSLLHIFFQRGAFTSNSTYLTFEVLKYYTIGLVFYSGYLIFVKFFYSINQYRTVMWLSIIAFFLKIILNFSLINNYMQNGMAFSTSLVYIFLFFAGYFSLNRSYIKGKVLIPFMQIIYYLSNGIISFLITSFLISLIGPIQDLIQVLIALFVFISIYIYNSYVISDNEGYIIISPIYNIFKKTMGLLNISNSK
jgi:putative peptidoglycan lipid II flippase